MSSKIKQSYKEVPIFQSQENFDKELSGNVRRGNSFNEIELNKRSSKNWARMSNYTKEYYQRYSLADEEENRKAFYSSYQQDPPKPKADSFYDYKFSSKVPPSEKTKIRDDFIHDIEIVNNQNERERVKISFQPGKLNVVDKIPNKMDFSAREAFFNQFNFTKDYRSGYTPIDIQANQEKELTYRDHFIKKYSNIWKLQVLIFRKQACSSTRLKRTCGVSYVKQQESEQLNVDNIFEKLPPLVFQGSTECVKLDDYQKLIEQIVDNIFKEQQGSSLIITTLDDDNENQIRDYLLHPEKRLRLAQGKIYLLRSINDLRQFFKEKQFVCIHLIYDEKQLVRPLKFEGLSQYEVIHDLFFLSSL